MQYGLEIGAAPSADMSGSECQYFTKVPICQINKLLTHIYVFKYYAIVACLLRLNFKPELSFPSQFSNLPFSNKGDAGVSQALC
jgi:hypothetical protein